MRASLVRNGAERHGEEPNMAKTSWLFVSFGEQERSWGGTRYDKRL
jgi:hypothetical protein